MLQMGGGDSLQYDVTPPGIFYWLLSKSYVDTIIGVSLVVYIVGSRGASQLGGSLLGIPLGYKAN